MTNWIDEMLKTVPAPDSSTRIVEDIEGAILPMARAACGFPAGLQRSGTLAVLYGELQDMARRVDVLSWAEWEADDDSGT